MSVAAVAVPGMLIVRLKPAKGQPSFESAIGDYLANEFQSDGRVAPIVWGLGDPVYRAAVQEGKIKTESQTPALGEALDAARKLHAEYVLAADIRGDADGILSIA